VYLEKPNSNDPLVANLTKPTLVSVGLIVNDSIACWTKFKMETQLALPPSAATIDVDSSTIKAMSALAAHNGGLYVQINEAKSLAEAADKDEKMRFVAELAFGKSPP
jgi:hypothetical protein